MTTRDVDDYLRPLADHQEDFILDGGELIFTRHGIEHILQVRHIPNIGLGVRTSGDSAEFQPVSTYVQTQLLRVPVLASQIARAVERASKSRPVRYIDSPARVEVGGELRRIERVGDYLAETMLESLPGETRIFQVMASAGQGKTIMLDALALRFALQYSPREFPTPLMLNVDLLGRYVGTLDDAIAGSLNNTYIFPQLSQRDVVYCVRHGWLILALDGFDELVARVGSKDAFLRLNDLIEQLDGHGTLLISARESFFELYQVSSALRNYVQPKRGSFSASSVLLSLWDEEHGRSVFAALGSRHPEVDLSELLSAFEEDREIVLHPFFLPRLADLWLKGERFGQATAAKSRHARTRYVIDTYIQRESSEKWVDRDKNPLLSAALHRHLLGVIAEEMWRSGAFRLDDVELTIAAEMALSNRVDEQTLQSVLPRVPTHAALAPRGGMSAFLHDRFFYYYLGVRIASLLQSGDVEPVRAIFAAGEVVPDVHEWVAAEIAESPCPISAAMKGLSAICVDSSDALVIQNASAAAAALAPAIEGGGANLTAMSFSGDSLRGRVIRGARFERCAFGQSDLKFAQFIGCQFVECRFGELLINSETSFGGSSFDSINVYSICDDDQGITHFDPKAIRLVLSSFGAKVPAPPVALVAPVEDPHSPELIAAVESLLRLSDRRTDVSFEEYERKASSMAQTVVRAGLKTGVLRTVTRSASGPRKEFIRFGVDKASVLPGRMGGGIAPQIKSFWEVLRAN